MTRGLTLVGIAVSNLSDGHAVQMALPFGRRSTTDLDQAMDAVRDRFGARAIGRTGQLGRDPGLEMPMLDDE